MNVSRVASMAPLFESGINAVIPAQRIVPADLLDPKVKNRSRLHYLMAESWDVSLIDVTVGIPSDRVPVTVTVVVVLKLLLGEVWAATKFRAAVVKYLQPANDILYLQQNGVPQPIISTSPTAATCRWV